VGTFAVGLGQEPLIFSHHALERHRLAARTADDLLGAVNEYLGLLYLQIASEAKAEQCNGLGDLDLDADLKGDGLGGLGRSRLSAI
jgi:hypothetical protein